MQHRLSTMLLVDEQGPADFLLQCFDEPDLLLRLTQGAPLLQPVCAGLRTPLLPFEVRHARVQERGCEPELRTAELPSHGLKPWFELTCGLFQVLLSAAYLVPVRGFGLMGLRRCFVLPDEMFVCV